MRYRAFISYSHADAATAAWLHRKLEGWRVPRRMRAENPALPDRLAPVFRDREELGSAGELGPQIQNALSDSEALIVLCSPEAARSQWVDKEVRAFRASGRGERVFALIVGGEPHSGDDRECFPASLRESEPLAADLRAGKDGKELALLKLIAGLLQVPLDTLRQREARRRHQRMLAITSLALAVMMITSFLAVQAVIARQAAERRQKQAEALVGFMLGDLNDKLSEVSRLDILEGAHEHAMAYFQSLPEDDVTDESLVQRAKAFTLIGNVRREQGHYPQAMEAYVAAARLTEKLARAKPGDLDRQLAYAEVLAYEGTTHWYEGDLDRAQASFDASSAVLGRAQKVAPRNPELLSQLSIVANNAGHILESRGRIDEATKYYEGMLANMQLLVSIEPKKVEWQVTLGAAHNNLAKMALLHGDLRRAVASYRADMAIETALLQANPRNNAQAESLVRARGALGRTLAIAGELDEGAKYLQLAVDESRRLVSIEPGSVGFQEDAGLYARQLARLRLLQGDGAAAQALAGAALHTFDALLAKEAGNAFWLHERANALAEQAMQLPDAQARAPIGAALAILEKQLAAQPDDRDVLLDTAAAQLRMASLEPPAQALPRLQAALRACDGVASAAQDPRLRALRVELLLRTGDRAAAATLASELAQSGYRDAGFTQMLHESGLAPAMPALVVRDAH